MSLVIDLHCHILPGIDDGPATLDEALDLARAAVAAGTTTVAATPHVNHAYPGNDAAAIARALEGLRGGLAQAGVPLEVVPGAEVALTRALELDDEELAALRLGGGPYLLLECPNLPSAVGLESAIASVQARGHRILLAHAERIPAFQQDIGLVERLVSRGMLVQVTAAAVAGRYGRPVRQFADELLRAGLVHDVASDAHSATRRGPEIAERLREGGWEAVLDHVARVVPRAILDGAEVAPAASVKRRSLFRRR